MTFDTQELKPVDWRSSPSPATFRHILTDCPKAAIPGDTPGTLAANSHPGWKDNYL